MKRLDKHEIDSLLQSAKEAEEGAQVLSIVNRIESKRKAYPRDGNPASDEYGTLHVMADYRQPKEKEYPTRVVGEGLVEITGPI